MKIHIEKNPKSDEIWVTEHNPIYTTGLNKRESKLPKSSIPHLFVDRGGKITFHGPGQIIFYFLISLERNRLSIRQLVSGIEDSILLFLKKRKVVGELKKNAPGVYIDQKKIASIGLRVKKGFTYHGVSLNVNMNLKPFLDIDPCGYEDLKMAQLNEYLPEIDQREIVKEVLEQFKNKFRSLNEK
ncbi:MAG: lipoyl(octanoyl) transferase LipB [Nitrosomonadales bacterium]|nr:lipoyl(octanoyl) transferase LipB [Nitrosomonadales bacterium]MBT3917915.1 lipoyl(octanoyl) transferase LipB [Nitrosomonadales bacterium]MBT4183331.1 lipoyl(octanoyl) transferase LipB [Nitrosomonadales bacterium]MBT4571072.1 lipoyl(octanoyl) transferase LipB [Nitrosomonadales bacterium]MBT4759559.1 lipoyl(octanoyl) transferase LipB [Nitrosomonadales bacterium]